KLRHLANAFTAQHGLRGLALASGFRSSLATSGWTDRKSHCSRPKATTSRILRKAPSVGSPTSNTGFDDILPTRLSCSINIGPTFSLPHRFPLPSQTASLREQKPARPPAKAPPTGTSTLPSKP